VSDGSIFLSGATALACLAIGLFFFRFYRQSGDRFFVLFALAFWVLAGNRAALLFVPEEEESARTAIYVIRLVAFCLILAAIIDKNRGGRPARR
jgi:hypothetical protein